MSILSPEIQLPKIEFQYIIDKKKKLLRAVSTPLDPITMRLLLTGEIRLQIWLEREVKKGSGGKTKRSWVHSIDNSATAPEKLFQKYEYNYGGGKGWGWKNSDITINYSTTNGFVPTEFEILPSDVHSGKIIKLINVIDIFSNILKYDIHREALHNDEVEKLVMFGRGKSSKQPLRVKLVANYSSTMLVSEPSNTLILGFHIDELRPKLNVNELNKFIKISYHR